MPRILLVKTSSLGDVVHNLPVATDIRQERPEIRIDWLVEEQYVPLVALHPAVDRIIPIALRRWRRHLLSGNSWREMGMFLRALRQHAYVAVIDTQGLLKSALAARMARGPVYGFGPRTAREPLASCFYSFASEFPPEAHKILRYRSVAARALGYNVPKSIDYGIAAHASSAAFAQGRCAVLFHATARAAKLWPEGRWKLIIAALSGRGWQCILPWGSEAERSRSERLASAAPGTLVPSRLALGDMAALLARAELVIGVDTGLMHLAAALSRPVVGIFCDSNPMDACPVGSGPTTYRGGIGSPPSVDAVLGAIGEVVSF